MACNWIKGVSCDKYNYNTGSVASVLYAFIITQYKSKLFINNIMCLCNTMSPAAKIVRKNYLKHKGNRESHKVIDLGVKIASLVQK